MRKITLICVGKLKEKYLFDALAEYQKRLTRFFDFKIVELAECKLTNSNTPARVIESEGREILEKIKGKNAYALAIEGEQVSSEEFAEIIERDGNNGEICFVIGGSYGLSNEVKQKCKKISFGRVTYPHQLMRVIFAEQLYRAATIINNVEYHK